MLGVCGMSNLRRVGAWLYRGLLGQHPHNTFLSFNWHNVRHIRRFLEAQGQQLEGGPYVVADIGGGKCPYYPYLADLAREFICVDLRENLPPDDGRPIRKVPGTGERIPLEDDSVDIVLCNQVLEHVIDPHVSCREMHRILRKDGMFIGSVPHASPVHLEPHDFRRFTDLGIIQLLENTGFDSISVEGNGGVFSAVALLINMDLLLTKREPGKAQNFKHKTAFILCPLVGCINLAGMLLDRVTGDRNRTPANLCWAARKA